MRILVSGGGTGGHIYPALAVARALQERHGAELLFLGDANGLETRIVPQAGVPFVSITAGKLRRYLSLGTITDLGRIPVGMAQALRHVGRFRPHAAFTSGGYVSVPAGVAARLHGAPLLMHQQDLSPNLANRLLTPVATRISVSFPASVAYFPKGKTSLAGNPVREPMLAMMGADPAALKARLGFDPHLPLLLVTGGSQGARHLNQVVAGALPYILPRCQVLHVSGQLTYDETRAQAAERLASAPTGGHMAARYQLHAYLDDPMPAALAASDIVLCRSGASTLAELALLAKPSLLVPLPPGFSGSPQLANAQMFAQAGAATIVLDRDLTVERLAAALPPLLGDPARLAAMGAAARAFARPDAAATLADAVAALAARRARGR
ncbi:MAG TPA: undecaprenyldiphospho-muramoylpentapeptide beta-N-acetylglucosaminyltransferase [Ktedonobacterales bacterium]|nr:undecaprenyldiphospho-muramoylpentapeptide beta-N-acetylglucosaminyltransferase [Ktedonobacterales bacterium]